MSLAEDIVRRANALATARQPWHRVWQDIEDYVRLRGGDFIASHTPGAARTDKVFDSTAPLANMLLASALHGNLTNPAMTWFSLKAEDPDLNDIDAVKIKLADDRDRMLAVYNSPAFSFTTAIHEFYLDLGSFGTAVMFIGDPLAGDTLDGPAPLFQTHPLSECFAAVGANGKIDTLYRRYKRTARQIAQRWPKTHSGDVAKALEKDPEAEFELIHAVFPRRERDPKRIDSANLPIASIHIETKGQHLLSEKGFHEFPYVVGRWTTLAGETYGRGPAWLAMPDIKMINAMAEDVIEASHKALDPPLALPDDGVLSQIDNRAGGLMYGAVNNRGQVLVHEIASTHRVDISLNMMEQRREQIRQAFFAPLINRPDNPVKTATQSLIERDERLLVMSPQLGRLQADTLGPMQDRLYAIMNRAGRFKPPPPELFGQRLAVEYQSPVAKAQRSSELLGVSRSLDILAPFIQSGDPQVLDPIDTDELAVLTFDLNGVPPKIIRSKKAIAERRQARADAAQAETAKADAERAAGGVATLARANKDLAIANRSQP